MEKVYKEDAKLRKKILRGINRNRMKEHPIPCLISSFFAAAAIVSFFGFILYGFVLFVLFLREGDAGGGIVFGLIVGGLGSIISGLILWLFSYIAEELLNKKIEDIWWVPLPAQSYLQFQPYELEYGFAEQGDAFTYLVYKVKYSDITRLEWDSNHLALWVYGKLTEEQWDSNDKNKKRHTYELEEECGFPSVGLPACLENFQEIKDKLCVQTGLGIEEVSLPFGFRKDRNV